MANQETEYDDEHLYDRTPWAGVSCTSYLWPYTQRDEVFETRRAVANLTHGLRLMLPTSVLADNDEVSAADVLHFVKAANQVFEAAEKTLREVVAEAISHGATWPQVGKVLGIKRSGAHKRFHEGLSDQRKQELKDETLGCMMLYAGWTGQISAEELGLDSTSKEDTGAETAVDYAFRSTMKAIELYEAWIREANEEPNIKKLYRVYDIIRSSLHIFMLPESLDTWASYSNTPDLNLPNWTDSNASTYFIQAACHLAFAFDHFNKLWSERRSGQNRTTTSRLAYIHHNLSDAILNLIRPECVIVLGRMEKEIISSGNTLYTEKRQKEGLDMSQWEIFTAVWRKDKAKVSKLFGFNEVRDPTTLDEFLDLIAPHEQ